MRQVRVVGGQLCARQPSVAGHGRCSEVRRFYTSSSWAVGALSVLRRRAFSALPRHRNTTSYASTNAPMTHALQPQTSLMEWHGGFSLTSNSRMYSAANNSPEDKDKDKDKDKGREREREREKEKDKEREKVEGEGEGETSHPHGDDGLAHHVQSLKVKNGSSEDYVRMIHNSRSVDTAVRILSNMASHDLDPPTPVVVDVLRYCSHSRRKQDLLAQMWRAFESRRSGHSELDLVIELLHATAETRDPKAVSLAWNLVTKHEHLNTDGRVLHAFLRVCANCSSDGEDMQKVDEAVVFLQNSVNHDPEWVQENFRLLMRVCANLGETERVMSLFGSINEPGQEDLELDSDIYESVIRAIAADKSAVHVLKVAREILDMCKADNCLSPGVYAAMLNCCAHYHARFPAKREDVSYAQDIWSEYRHSDLGIDDKVVVAYLNLLWGTNRRQHLDKALKIYHWLRDARSKEWPDRKEKDKYRVFDRVHGHDRVSLCSYDVYVAMIKLCDRDHQQAVPTALALLREMEEDGYRPRLYTFNSVIRSCRRTEDRPVETALEVYERIRKRHDLSPTDDTFLGIIWACGQVPSLESMLALDEFYEEIKSTNPQMLGEKTYGALIESLGRVTVAKNRAYSRCCRIFEDAKAAASPEPPGRPVYDAFIKACLVHRNSSRAVQVYNEMLECGIDPSVATYSNLIAVYAGKKDVESAMEVFNDMKRRGCIPTPRAYASLIYVHGHMRGLRSALRVYHDLLRSKEEPSSAVLFTMASVCERSKMTDSEEAFRTAVQLLRTAQKIGLARKGAFYECLLSICWYISQSSRPDDQAQAHEFARNVILDMNEHFQKKRQDRPWSPRTLDYAEQVYSDMVSQGDLKPSSKLRSLLGTG